MLNLDYDKYIPSLTMEAWISNDMGKSQFKGDWKDSIQYKKGKLIEEGILEGIPKDIVETFVRHPNEPPIINGRIIPNLGVCYIIRDTDDHDDSPEMKMHKVIFSESQITEILRLQNRKI